MRGINKRGSAHFEIMISFILFVGFTLFLIFSLEPTKQDLLENSILFGVKNAFFDNAMTNVTTALVQKNVSNCGSASACLPTEISGQVINSSVNDGTGCFYYVYASTEFTNNLLTPTCLSIPQNYSLGYIERQQVLSNRTLQEIQAQYYSDYNSSKNRFGVPAVVDFAVLSNNLDLSKTIPDDAAVISGVYRYRVVYGNGSIINQDFVVKVW